MDTDTPVSRVSAQIAAAGLSAAVIGLLDATLVQAGLAGAAGSFQYVPLRLWIVSPVVWGILAAVLCIAALPLRMWRTWSGLLAPAALTVIFLVIRMRGHVALLAAALAVFFVLLVLTRRWILQWMARPRRALAVSVAGGVTVAAIVAVAQLYSVSGNPARGAAGPNVIVIFLDTVRYDAVFDADGRVTSTLASLARLRAGSTAFTRAYSTSSWTLPSHLSAVTGLPAHQLGVSFDSQEYTRPDPTLAERFQRRGYRTAAVISNSFVNTGSGFARGFDTFQQAQAALDLCRTGPGVIADTHWPWFAAAVCNWTASEVTARARALMDDADGPFFLALNYMDAHDPYYVERACGEPDGYAAALRCLDRSLAPIVDWRSSRRPTVLAVVGDHGEQFGEHGLVRHGNSLYVQALHVPLIVRSADGGAARTDARPISIAALPSLVDSTSAPPTDGPVIALLHPPAASHLPSQWSALDGAWHLIMRDNGSDALYYLPDDPAEERNLIATNPAGAGITRLRAAIAEMRREPRPDLRRFRSLGYVH